jgi:hypothetical protein
MIAEEERRMISRRTKDALAVAKRRGVKLGGYRAGSKLTALYASRDCRVTGGRRYVIAGRRSGPERPWDTNRARYRSLVCDRGVAIGGTVCAVCPAPTIPSSARQARSCEMSLLGGKNRDLRQVPEYGAHRCCRYLKYGSAITPGQKHSLHSPHSPRQDPGNGEPGNGGKDIPVNDLVSSNAKENHLWNRDRPVECLVQADQ